MAPYMFYLFIHLLLNIIIILLLSVMALIRQIKHDLLFNEGHPVGNERRFFV